MCRACHKPIHQDALRIGRQYDVNHSSYLYWHPVCFPQRYLKPGVTEADFFFGWEKLSVAQQQQISQALRRDARKPPLVEKKVKPPAPKLKSAVPSAKSRGAPKAVKVEAAFSSLPSFSNHAGANFEETLRAGVPSAWTEREMDQLVFRFSHSDPIIVGAWEAFCYDGDFQELKHTLQLLHSSARSQHF
jgi:hypothetical protein